MLRFSPNHTDASALGFVDVTPSPSYALAFGDHRDLGEQAYFFDFAYADGRDPTTYASRLDSEVSRWNAIKARPFAPRLELFSIFGRRVVVDSRRRGAVGTAIPRLCVVDRWEWELLQRLESPTRLDKLQREWTLERPLGPILESFVARDWVVEADERLVRLVVIRPDPRPHVEARRVLVAKSRASWRALRRWIGSWSTPRGEP